MVAQLGTQRQQADAIIRAGDNPVAAQLAVENLNRRGFQEPDASVAASGAGFKKEVRKDVEPAEHGQ